MMSEDYRKLAAERRVAAHGMRRLARTISLNADRAKLMQQAADLEAEADTLERRAAAIEAHQAPPAVAQEQVQQQQQAAEKKKPEG
jgi:hypothetical protein